MADAPTPAPVAEPPKPTEEQVKEANEAREKHWQGDFSEEDLKVPYKREVEDAEKKEKTEPKTDGEDNSSTDGDAGDSDNDSSEETYSEPAPVVTVQDPGEYKAADYSFDAILADGKSVKITTPEDAERLSEDPDNFKTPKQLLDFIKKTTQMQSKLDKDYSDWQLQKNNFEAQKQTEAERRDTVTSVANEISYLVGKGKLPKVAAQYASADWSDPEVAKQTGVKEQMALLIYMNKENAIRAKAGIKPFGPVDALTAMQNDKAEQDKITARKAAGEARKSAGAKVAGVSPAQTGTYVPKGIAVGNPNIMKRGQAVWDN